MMMAHPKAYNGHWHEQRVPLETCPKSVEEHNEEILPDDPTPMYGPCLSKCYDLLPKDAGEPYPLYDVDTNEMSTLYLRQIGSTVYSYTPTGEDASGLVPAFWGIFPISGVDFIAGHPDERYQQQWEDALARVKAAGFKAAIITIDEEGEEHIIEEIEGTKT